jgi:eukaryotic-like serine/threonine-protein kinase
MGEVYRATDSRLKREVALKVLPADVAGDPSRLARFQREAELLASLNHPHVAHVYGFQQSGAVTALVMELVDGEDLSQRIARGPLPLAEVLSLAKQIAEGLDAAHERGIVHRDLKPANVRVRPDGTVKLIDFGLAKALAPGGHVTTTETALSLPGVIVGTPAYMSPEQARGEMAGREADAWSFGVVLYEMLTGNSPFAGPTATDTLVQVLTASPDLSRLPPGTPPAVHRLIRRCLERSLAERWRNLADARIELEEALADRREPSHTAAPPSTTRLSRRTVLLSGAAATLLGASGFAGGAWLRRRDRPTSAPSYLRLTFRRGLVRSARFAPDGETILYGALWDGDPCRVHTVRIDGPESRALDLPESNLLAISRTGELALALGPHEGSIITYGTLARVPIAGGAPRQILDMVRFADWSPDGSELAVIRRAGFGDQLEYPIGKVLVRPDTGLGSGLGFVRIAPDGTRLAFVHYASVGSLEGRVSLVDRSGTITPLSPKYRNIHGLTWRGDEVVFTAADDRPLFRALLAVTPGTAPRTLSRLPTNVTVWDARPDGRLVMAQTDDRSVLIVRSQGDEGDRDLSWLDASVLEDLSIDGRLLLFTEIGQGGGAQSSAYLRGVDGSASVRLAAGRALALSPDTRWAAVRRSSGDSAPDVELLPTGAGEPRRLPADGLQVTGARWLPDGRRIALSAIDPGGGQRLFLHDLGSGQRTALTPEGVLGWALAPDGSAVAVRELDQRIRVHALDGSAPRELAGAREGDSLVGWFTGGVLVRWLDEPRSTRGQIYRIDSKTGVREPWRTILPNDMAGIMALSAFCVTPDGQSQAYTWHRALSNLYLAEGLA